MSDTPPESAPQIFAEGAWLAGAIITGAGYGVVIALFWLCFRALWCQLKHRSSARRRNMFFLFYVCILFVVGSLLLGSNSLFTQYAFINNRGYPGGPSAYEQQMWSIGADEVGNVSYVLGNWLADSMLVWRCIIIYKNFGALSGRIVLALTCLTQLASYVMGTFFLLQLSSPQSSPYSYAGSSINWTVPYLCVSLTINIALTTLITIRLLLYRRTMVQLLGPGHATECTTVVAMLVESAAVYTTFVLLFFIPYLMQNPISYTFVQVAGEAQLIAPLLIIYREAQGKGWISSASSVSSTTAHGDCDIHIGRFSDIEFASDASYPHPPGGRGEEIRRCRREEIELEEL
ncbi:hypothetical protein JVT61DRAFT_8632 [Boletus reticuloceps]|uniref:Uncharacterized protein n=1 Tax=Boletus reticuloceps TaxID=495285 RepID=A0A8I2YWC2_9AGAM|nr:hypothetical protein JVT61DRAFT_8632 [Boletus reticuloceps]